MVFYNSFDKVPISKKELLKNLDGLQKMYFLLERHFIARKDVSYTFKNSAMYLKYVAYKFHYCHYYYHDAVNLTNKMN